MLTKSKNREMLQLILHIATDTVQIYLVAKLLQWWSAGWSEFFWLPSIFFSAVEQGVSAEFPAAHMGIHILLAIIDIFVCSFVATQMISASRLGSYDSAIFVIVFVIGTLFLVDVAAGAMF